MEDLKNILEEIKKLKSKDFKPSDDCMLECATKIYNTTVINTNGSGPKREQADPNSPATERQISYLGRLKVKVKSEDLTMGEASALIKEALEKQKSEKEKKDE